MDENAIKFINMLLAHCNSIIDEDLENTCLTHRQIKVFLDIAIDYTKLQNLFYPKGLVIRSLIEGLKRTTYCFRNKIGFEAFSKEDDFTTSQYMKHSGVYYDDEEMEKFFSETPRKAHIDKYGTTPKADKSEVKIHKYGMKKIHSLYNQMYSELSTLTHCMPMTSGILPFTEEYLDMHYFDIVWSFTRVVEEEFKKESKLTDEVSVKALHRSIFDTLTCDCYAPPIKK